MAKRENTGRKHDERPAASLLQAELSLPVIVEQNGSSKPATRSLSARQTSVRQHLTAWLVIAVVAWVANFLHCREFGFYEDDWFSSTMPYGWSSWSDVFAYMRQYLAAGAQGRPLGIVSLLVLNYIGALFSSITLLYVIAFVFVALGGGMFYTVLSQRFRHPFPLLAALVFVLSPLVTIRQHINIQFNETGGAFFLVFTALLLYMRGRKVLSYVVAALTFLCLESVFFVFAAAPFLDRPSRLWRRTTWRKFAAHAAICVGITIVYFALRRMTGESRVADIPLNWKTLATGIVHFDLWYTLHSFELYIYAAYLAWRESGLEAYLYCLAGLIPLLAALWRLPRTQDALRRFERTASRRKNELWLRVLCVSVLVLMAGYAISFFHIQSVLFLPYQGRDTRIHFAATVGSSMVAAGALTWLLAITHKTRMQWVGRCAAGGFLCVFFLYGFVVQDDYVQNWKDQKDLIIQMVMLTPDIDPDSHIIIQHDPLIGDYLFPGKQRRPSMGYQHHGLQWIADNFLGWIQGYRTVVTHTDDWKKHLKTGPDGKLYWTQESFLGAWGLMTDAPMVPGKIISIKKVGPNSYVRSSEPLMVDGKQVIQILPPPPFRASQWPLLATNRLFSMLVPEYAVSNVLAPTTLPPGPFPPMADSVSPREVSGVAQRLRIVVSDANGADDIENTFFLIQSGLRTEGACYGAVSMPGVVKMPDDQGRWGYVMVGNGSIGNAACTVNAADASVQVRGSSVEIDLPIRLEGSQKRAKEIYIQVTDKSGRKSSWRQLGRWRP